MVSSKNPNFHITHPPTGGSKHSSRNSGTQALKNFKAPEKVGTGIELLIFRGQLILKNLMPTANGLSESE